MKPDDRHQLDEERRSAPTQLYRWRFGAAEFDEARFELRVGGLLVDVQQKPLQLLALLLATPGETVTKDRIFDMVWNGRATGDAVLANAVSKLRGALGPEHAASIATVARQGYRFDGAVERVAVGRRLVSRLALEPGAAVPGRDNYQLVRQLGASHHNETWLARQPRTGDQRVYKFALDGERLADLKREVTLYRVLRGALGDRDHFFVRVIDWNFEQLPYWLECDYAGVNLMEWATQTPGDPAAEPPQRDSKFQPQGATTRLAAAPRALRLHLLLMAADAVAAAHGVGVLHKDLKPGNILVEPAALHSSDDTPPAWRVRLTDFGSGRLLEPERLEALNITQLGMTVASCDSSSGTPFYMAPELGRGEPLTAAADVYALGVVLYQLIVGDLKRVLAPGWEREIDDELLRDDIAAATDVDPTLRLASAAELAQRLRTLPQRRAEREAARAQAERARRVEADLERERARRPWVLAAMLALALGAGASWWAYRGQREASVALAREHAVSQALNRVLREDLIGAANPARNGRADITVADALKAAAERIDEKFGNEAPAVRGSLHAAMQRSLADLSRSGDSVQAGQRAVAALKQAQPIDLVQLQDARLLLALHLTQLSKLDDARATVKDIEAEGGPVLVPGAARVRLLVVKSWLTEGDAALRESAAYLEQAQALGGAQGVESTLRYLVAFALADNYAMLGRLNDAEVLQRRLVDDQRREFGADDPRPLYAMVGLGRTMVMQSKFTDARAVLEPAAQGLTAKLGANHRHTLTARDQLAEIEFRERNYAVAAQAWQHVHQGFVALMGEGSSYAVTVQTNHAMALHYGGKPDAAEPLLRIALAHLRAFANDDLPQAQHVRYALADCLLDLKREADVPALLAGLDAQALNAAQQEPDWDARLQFQRARLAIVQGDTRAAKDLLRLAADSLSDQGRLDRKTAVALLESLR